MDVDNTESSTSAYHTSERKKSNLAFAFFCMDKERARDMEIFYAFCRLMDDIADEENNPKQARRDSLTRWKDDISSIYAGKTGLSALAEEMRGVINRRKVPQEYVQAIIDGVMRDTFEEPFEAFEDIRKYCYGVASAVGLVSIHIFGCKNPRTIQFAESLGYALQFTNILRDVVDDYRNHKRVYIPREELDAFGVSEEDLADPSKNPNCKELFRFMHFRAKHFFNKSRRLIANEDKRALAPALIMWAIYEKILDNIAESDFSINEIPVKISKAKKIALALGAIRESKRPERQDKMSGKAAVLGGGVAGCAMALRLAYEGFDVSLFEARPQLGGRASQINWEAAALDNGTHALMGCYDNFFAVLRTLGTAGREYFKPVEGMDFIFPTGKKYSVKYPSEDSGILKKLFSFLSYTKVKGFASLDNIRLLTELKFGLVFPRPKESALDFLKSMKVPHGAIKAFWEPFCVSALNTPLKDADAQLMANTIKKCILKGDAAAILYLPQRPILSALSPRTEIYIKGCGGNVYLSESVNSLKFRDGRIIAVSTSKCDACGCDHVFSALPVHALKSILHPYSKLRARLEKIKFTDILNIYFTSSEKILDSEYACIIDSPIHWIFDHSEKLPDKETGKAFLYGATVSASTLKASNAQIETMLKEEIKKFFGKNSVLKVLPLRFAAATISADADTEQARPKDEDIRSEFENLHICGDWVQTDLPCTIESAAKSANDVNL